MAEEERFAPFADAARARDADRLGMLIFLASEIMLFGGIFAAALALRLEHGPDYAAAAGHLKLWLGTANTAILLTSSLMAALAALCAAASGPGRMPYSGTTLRILPPSWRCMALIAL